MSYSIGGRVSKFFDKIKSEINGGGSYYLYNSSLGGKTTRYTFNGGLISRFIQNLTLQSLLNFSGEETIGDEIEGASSESKTKRLTSDNSLAYFMQIGFRGSLDAKVGTIFERGTISSTFRYANLTFRYVLRRDLSLNAGLNFYKESISNTRTILGSLGADYRLRRLTMSLKNDLWKEKGPQGARTRSTTFFRYQGPFKRSGMIEKSFKHKFILRFTGIVLTGMGVMALLLYIAIPSSGTRYYADAIISFLKAEDALSGVIMVALIMESIVISGVVVLVAVLASHKIAGPVYSLQRVLNELVNTRRACHKFRPISFRSYDQLQNTARSFNTMINRLNGHSRAISDAYEEFERARKEIDDTPESAERLKERQITLGRRLKDSEFRRCGGNSLSLRSPPDVVSSINHCDVPVSINGKKAGP